MKNEKLKINTVIASGAKQSLRQGLLRRATPRNDEKRLYPKRYTLNATRGFSLLETIVAISILMITIVGPLALAAKGIAFANYVKDEITGFYLAQEAVEAIRNIRDSNIKNNRDWLATIKDNCMPNGSSGVPCRVDIWRYNESLAAGDQTDHGFENCNKIGIADESECEKLKVVDVGDPGSGTERLYGYSFTSNVLGAHIAQDSIFSRKITIKNVTRDYLAAGSTIPQSEQRFLQLDPTGIDEINVTVEVSWVRGSITRSVKVSENLFSI